jgi:hypothetical protein
MAFQRYQEWEKKLKINFSPSILQSLATYRVNRDLNISAKRSRLDHGEISEFLVNQNYSEEDYSDNNTSHKRSGGTYECSRSESGEDEDYEDEVDDEEDEKDEEDEGEEYEDDEEDEDEDEDVDEYEDHDSDLESLINENDDGNNDDH